MRFGKADTLGHYFCVISAALSQNTDQETLNAALYFFVEV
jgi:hypothetical protein